MPKVSVIVPVYGVEKYIERCARSLFEQTLDEIEYLFIDDCTLDRSVEILRSVLEEYPQRKEQVVIHRMEQNSGQAKVREWGMKNASGEYVIHCDSDDWVDTKMYQAMYSLAVQEESDVSICDFYKASPNGLTQLCGCHDKDLSIFIKNSLFQKESWSLCNKLFKRSLIKESVEYPKAALGEDMYIFFQIICKCKKISYISKPFYYYRYNAASITKKSTVSNCMYKYTTLKENTDKLILFLEKHYGSLNYIKAAEDFLRINNARCLLHALYLPEYRKIWNDTCKDVSLLRLLTCPHIGCYHKVVYLLTKISFLPRKSEWAKNA